MRENSFRTWMENHRGVGGAGLDVRTVDSRLSNCRTIERYHGDLDHHFDKDGLRGLIESLTYSTEDQRWDRPARHRIPICGNVRNGTATLKSAASLYKAFREDGIKGTPPSQRALTGAGVRRSPRAVQSLDGRDWPMWNQPASEDILEMAHVAMPHVRFLNPDVVRAVVEDNECHRAAWIASLQAKRIDPAAYLWEKSPCAFPGVRRYAGSREIAAHRGHTRLDADEHLNALALDDNDYPKQLWSFVFRGLQFSKFGPEGYSLAHLTDHKDHGNRFEQDFDVMGGTEGVRPLFGLYTCPSNTVYIPTTLIKPTDFVGTIRALLLRRVQQLYGAFCRMLPPFLSIRDTFPAAWDTREFRWADPVGAMKHVPNFLAFRNQSDGEAPKQEPQPLRGRGPLVRTCSTLTPGRTQRLRSICALCPQLAAAFSAPGIA
jgi:hypothetical protein